MIRLRKISIFIITLVILFSGIGISASPAQAASCTAWYTVQPGDTLYKIGLKYGVTWTYLAKINNISNPNKIYSGTVLCVSTTAAPKPPAPGKTPTFSIVAVVADKKVTIQTYNFPANDSFNVLMGPYGSKGANGVKVGVYNSGNGASKQAAYEIPASLQGDSRIAIRLQSNTGSGYFAFNWFHNNSTGGNTGGGGVQPGYSGYPYFSITAVVRDNSVQIQGQNYPPNTNFDVYMGPYGTKAIGGYYVASFNSGEGGKLNKTFSIPPALYGSKKIAIRTQSNVYFAYNWFWNNNANAN